MRRRASADVGISLGDVLRSIHEDLVESTKERPEGWEPLFEIESAEVELFVRMTKDASVEGGVKAYVVSFGAKGSEAQERGHKITLRLSAVEGTETKGGPEVPVRRRAKQEHLHGTKKKAT
jgi:hypothetical protein